MAKKSLVILLVLAVVVAGAVGGTMIFLGQQNRAGQQTDVPGEPSSTPDANISDAQGMTITNIRLEHQDGSIELEQKDDIWSMADNIAPVDQISVENLAAYLSNIYATQTVDIGNTPLSTYGLDPGGLSVTYKTSRGMFTNYYGKYTTDKSAVFFRKASDNSVYTIDAQDYEGLQNNFIALKEQAVSLPSLEQTRYIAFKNSEETAVVLEQTGEENTVTWVMDSPYNLPVTKEALLLINDSFGSSVLKSYVGAEVLSKYGLYGQKWIEYKDSSGNVIMHIKLGAMVQSGADKDSCYCTIDGKQGVFLTGSLAQAVDSSAFSLIDKRLLPIDDFSLLDKLTISKDEQTVILTQINGAFTLNEKSLSKDKAKDLYDDISAVNFIDKVTQKVGAIPYCTILAEQDGLENIDIKVYLYLKDFYALDYGSGTQVYVDAEILDDMLDEFL